MNRRELLLGTIAAAVAPALPAVEDNPYLAVMPLRGPTGMIFALKGVGMMTSSPDTKWLAANDDFAMAS